MRKFCFLAVAAAVLAMATADQAQAGGRRTRYYSYGGTSAVAMQRSTSQAAQPSNATRRYSYSPATNGTVRYSYSPSYNSNRQPSWRADRKIMGMGY